MPGLVHRNRGSVMSYLNFIRKMTPEIHASLKRAIELGKWPDGRSLSAEQKAVCMEAVLNYDAQFLSEEQRVGYINRGNKSEGEQCGGDAPAPLKWS